MFTKPSPKNQLRFISLALIFSLTLSFAPGPMTGTSLAASSDEPAIQGEPGTPMQSRLAEAINQRLAAGLPAPKVTFGSESGNPTQRFGPLSAGEPMAAVGQTKKTTATTILYFEGPQEAGYEVWPAVKIAGKLAGENNSFDTGDLTEIIRATVEKQDPEFWERTPFGKEARQFTITETIEETSGSGPPTGMGTLGSLQTTRPANSLMSSPLESTTEDILMGFTYSGPHIKYIIEESAKSCIWLPFIGKRCIEWAYLKTGFELDWAVGLRLPASVNLAKAAGSGTTFETSLTPQDWSEDQYAGYGVAPEQGNEFALRLDFWVGVLVRAGGKEICPISPYPCYLDLSRDYSDTFTTPFGEGTSFPIPALAIPLLEISGAGIITANFNLTITPLLYSTNIQADWLAKSGDTCSETGSITYTAPGEAVQFTPKADCFSSSTAPIDVKLNNFRYNFDRFKLAFGVQFTFDVLGLWSKNVDVPVFNLDLSMITRKVGLFVSDHVQCSFLFVCGRTGPDNILQLSASSDTTPPIITYSIEGSPGKDGWYRDDVKLTWTVEDGESDFTTQGCEQVLITADQIQTKYTCTATSAGGEAQVDVLIGRDTTAPIITCPAADPFLLNSGDHMLGPADVEASIAGLDPKADNVLTGILTTGTVEPKILTFRAFDLAGNKADVACSYAVFYNIKGFLPPVKEMNFGKAGRTYPIKWQLTDFNNNYIGDMSAVTKIEAKTSSACSNISMPTSPVEKINSEATWRYGSSARQYIYNWRTPRTPGCYALEMTLASGQVLTAIFDLK